MPEIRYTHPDLPDYVVELPAGVDPATVAAPGDDWTAEVSGAEAEQPAEVPVGDPINLTPETPADQAAPAEPETDQTVVSDPTKEK